MDMRKSMVRLCFGFGGILTIIELCCYLAYFQYIYHHDNKVAAVVVSQMMIKIRNKSNAISMVGQLTKWIMEVWYIILVGIFSTMFQVDLLREVSVLIRATEYFLIPLVQVLTSPPIKRFFKRGTWKMKSKQTLLHLLRFKQKKRTIKIWWKWS